MYIAISTVELFRLAEAAQALTKSLRIQESFGFICLDDESSWRLAKVEDLINRYIGEDGSGALEKEVNYYNGE